MRMRSDGLPASQKDIDADMIARVREMIHDMSNSDTELSADAKKFLADLIDQCDGKILFM